MEGAFNLHGIRDSRGFTGAHDAAVIKVLSKLPMPLEINKYGGLLSTLIFDEINASHGATPIPFQNLAAILIKCKFG